MNYRLLLANVAAVVAMAVSLYISDIVVQIIAFMVILISVVYAAEVSMALYQARLWYNVMVVSLAMALPQTIFAARLAQSYPVAAWIDTLASTLVDAILVTAVLRRSIVGGPIPINYLLIWSGVALTLNLYTLTPPSTTINYVYAAIGVLLPALLVRGVVGLPTKGQLVTLLNHSISAGVVSYELSNAIAQLPLHEVQLGVVSTILATLPDFIVAMMLRAVVSQLLTIEAGVEEALYTMLAAATHDQITIPAIILLLNPNAHAYFPHVFNVAVILLKFTLLNRRLFWFIGVPMAILMLIAPPV